MVRTPEPEVPSRASGSGSASAATQRDRVLSLLRSSPDTFTDLDVQNLLQIPYSAAGTRLVELYDRGLAEALPKKHRKDRQRWRAVPPERQEEVMQAALRRTRARLLSTFQRQPVWLQGWLVRRILMPNLEVSVQRQLLAEECPSELGTGPCTCPTPNIWVQRHEKGKATWSRVRRETVRWRNEQREQHKEAERANKEDPVIVQFLTDKGFAREAIHLVAHVTARVQDEIKLRQEKGIGEISDEKWEELRAIVSEIDPAVAELKAAIRLMLDDEGDWIDTQGYEDGDYGDIEDAELVELDEGRDAILNDDIHRPEPG